ncbi:amidoligase family protein [Agreia pratensis]|uniref:amidoligase family protein n=1 Tax=Agreia pratensis TaxID=150121 RepID=UPI00188A1AB7|nr:amidoligase family protein [Agreia pratensis]MBF4635752.1 amidoligase family protein [Agreia pratensis]
MTVLHERIGFEIELLAPDGAGRRTLAERICRERGGRVERFFHTDSEPSLVPGMGHFWHLTPGFAVIDSSGAPVATFVDDVTITADIARDRTRATPDAGGRVADASPASDEHSYRILSDDARLLRLIAGHTPPDTPFPRVLDDVAALFGSRVETIGTVRRLRDRAGASIAMATSLAAGRERPCEIVTPPLSSDHEAALESLLMPARELGFTVPVEAAVHLHFDGAPFRSVAAFSNLVRLFGHWREALRVALGTNPACTRLQALPPSLLELVESESANADASAGSSDAERWSALQSAARSTGLSKYFDVNLTALLTDAPARDTLEVRILPGALRASDIVWRAAFVEALLARCRDPRAFPRPTASDPVVAAAELFALVGFAPVRERATVGDAALA